MDGNYGGDDDDPKPKKRPKMIPVYENRKCLEKSVQVGGQYPTVEKCADALSMLGCKYVQFSSWDPNRDCKCCEEPEDGTGRQHKHWDVYYIDKKGKALP